jgi:hypothetical protein
MRHIILKNILAYLQKKAEGMSWPFASGSEKSILAAVAAACGISRDNFISLTEGKIQTKQGLEEILDDASNSKYERLREKLLSWQRSLPPQERSLPLLRQSLRAAVHHKEIQDTIMLLGFGEPVFPVSEMMRQILFSYHLFDSSHTYADMQHSIESALNGLSGITACFLSAKSLELSSDNQKKDLLRALRESVPLTCSNCGQDISHVRHPCIADISLFPSKNLFITEEDLARDFEKEWKEALESAKKYSPAQMEKQVYAHYRLLLCAGCRDRLEKKIDNGEIV